MVNLNVYDGFLGAYISIYIMQTYFWFHGSQQTVKSLFSLY